MTDYYRDWLHLADTFGDKSPQSVEYIMKHGLDIIESARNYKPETIYKYMITFTVKPEHRDNQDTIEKYIINLLKPMSYSFQYAKEHADTNVHWHCIIYMRSRIVSAKFRYYKQLYGFVDISRSKDLGPENGIKYISKESQVITVK